jgi:hypothetical protein
MNLIYPLAVPPGLDALPAAAAVERAPGRAPSILTSLRNISTRGRHIAHPVTIRPSPGATQEAIT